MTWVVLLQPVRSLQPEQTVRLRLAPPLSLARLIGNEQISTRARPQQTRKHHTATGDGRIELGGASAIVANQGGRAITDMRHADCFFDWIGPGRRATTKGLRTLEDLSGSAEAGAFSPVKANSAPATGPSPFPASSPARELDTSAPASTRKHHTAAGIGKR
jgi:hypothetical protein